MHNGNTRTEYTDTHGLSLRERVFQLLNGNHELKPKQIIILLRDPCITYEQHGETVRQYRKQWKAEYRNKGALNTLSFHSSWGHIGALKSMDRSKCLGHGASVHGSKTGVVVWMPTRAKNHMYLFNARPELGAVEWYENNNIVFWVSKPATWPKVKQLLAYAFSHTGIIRDYEVFELWVQSAEFCGAHLCRDLGVKLPYSKTEVLKDSNGVIVKTGDASHPTCLEIEFNVPKWAQKWERLAEIQFKQQEQTNRLLENVASSLNLTAQQQQKFNEILEGLNKPKNLDLKNPGRLYE